MRDAYKDYWSEAVGQALCEMGKYDLFTSAEIDELGEALAISAEHQSMAFYSPPPSDRLNEIDRDWKVKYDALKAEYESYQGNAETAVRKALGQYSDTQVSIGEYGEVFRHGGRTEQIQ